MDKNDTQQEGQGSWHLDKRVPLGLIFAVLLQTTTIVWFITDLRSDVDVLQDLVKREAQDLSAVDDRQWTRINKNEEHIQSSTASIQTNTAILERVEDRLTKLIDIIEAREARRE
jgi:hypothetical protein